MALRNLAANTINKDAIRKAQGIKPLIALLRDADTETKENAAAALRSDCMQWEFRQCWGCD
jgi:hypothetical protein